MNDPREGDAIDRSLRWAADQRRKQEPFVASPPEQSQTLEVPAEALVEVHLVEEDPQTPE